MSLSPELRTRTLAHDRLAADRLAADRLATDRLAAERLSAERTLQQELARSSQRLRDEQRDFARLLEERQQTHEGHSPRPKPEQNTSPLPPSANFEEDERPFEETEDRCETSSEESACLPYYLVAQERRPTPQHEEAETSRTESTDEARPSRARGLRPYESTLEEETVHSRAEGRGPQLQDSAQVQDSAQLKDSAQTEPTETLAGKLTSLADAGAKADAPGVGGLTPPEAGLTDLTAELGLDPALQDIDETLRNARGLNRPFGGAGTEAGTADPLMHQLQKQLEAQGFSEVSVQLIAQAGAEGPGALSSQTQESLRSDQAGTQRATGERVPPPTRLPSQESVTRSAEILRAQNTGILLANGQVVLRTAEGETSSGDFGQGQSSPEDPENLELLLHQGATPGFGMELDSRLQALQRVHAPAQPEQPWAGRVALALSESLQAMTESQEKTHRAVLDLRDPELGRLQLEVRVEGGMLKVEVWAEQEQARQLLREGRQQLEQALARQSYTLEHFNVGGEGARGQHFGARQGWQSRGRTEGKSSVLSPAPVSRTPRHDGQLDIIA
ncbi:MAG: flagellar hook-length control protein FliK [Myxococcota bacterium]